MRVVLFVLSVVALLAGLVLLPVHRIEACVLFAASAVLISGAAIVEAVNLLRKDIARLTGLS